jgi:hypothetical protein
MLRCSHFCRCDGFTYFAPGRQASISTIFESIKWQKKFLSPKYPAAWGRIREFPCMGGPQSRIPRFSLSVLKKNYVFLCLLKVTPPLFNYRCGSFILDSKAFVNLTENSNDPLQEVWLAHPIIVRHLSLINPKRKRLLGAMSEL